MTVTLSELRAQPISEPPSAIVQPVRRHTLRPLQISGGKIMTPWGPSKDATLSNVVEHLESKDPNANILLPAELGQIKIGDLQLSDAPTGLALQAASIASSNQFQVDERGGGIMSSLIVIEKPQKPGPASSDVIVRAFSLTGYLSYLRIDMLSRQAFRAF